MPNNESFLVHKVYIEKYRPIAFDVNPNFTVREQARYDVFRIYKYYDRNEPNDSGGHNISLELQFKLIDEEPHPDLEKLPIGAMDELYLEFHKRKPDPSTVKGFIMMFEILRKNYVPVEKKILRDGSEVGVMNFRFRDSDKEKYYGYSILLQMKYNEPSSRGKTLIDKGKVIHVVLVEGARQTTIDQYSYS